MENVLGQKSEGVIKLSAKKEKHKSSGEDYSQKKQEFIAEFNNILEYKDSETSNDKNWKIKELRSKENNIFFKIILNEEINIKFSVSICGK